MGGFRGLVTLNIPRKALLGPEDCQQEGIMSRCPFLRVWSPETTHPEGTLMVEPIGMRVVVAGVAGRALTIAAQASVEVDLIYLVTKAAVEDRLHRGASWASAVEARLPRGGSWALQGLGVVGPRATIATCLLGLPGFSRTAVLLEGLWGHLPLLQL